MPFNTFAEPRELDHLLRHSDVGIVITQDAFLHHRYADEILQSCHLSSDARPGLLRTPAYPFLRRIVALDATDGGVVQTWELRDGMAFRIQVFGTLVDALEAAGAQRPA